MEMKSGKAARNRRGKDLGEPWSPTPGTTYLSAGGVQGARLCIFPFISQLLVVKPGLLP